MIVELQPCKTAAARLQNESEEYAKTDLFTAQFVTSLYVGEREREREREGERERERGGRQTGRETETVTDIDRERQRH